MGEQRGGDHEVKALVLVGEAVTRSIHSGARVVERVVHLDMVEAESRVARLDSPPAPVDRLGVDVEARVGPIAEVIEKRGGHAPASAPGVENVGVGIEVGKRHKVVEEVAADAPEVRMPHHDASLRRRRVVGVLREGLNGLGQPPQPSEAREGHPVGWAGVRR